MCACRINTTNLKIAGDTTRPPLFVIPMTMNTCALKYPSSHTTHSICAVMCHLIIHKVMPYDIKIPLKGIVRSDSANRSSEYRQPCLTQRGGCNSPQMTANMACLVTIMPM